MKVPVETIEAMIYVIRDQRVMLDSDLAKLYGIGTKVLNQAVRRNRERFPADFLIEPDSNELAQLRSQIVTLANPRGGNPKFRHSPFLFTENGVAMLSSVLHSSEAIQINITIMRAFTKLRSFLAMGDVLTGRIGELEKNTNHLFKIVFERLDVVEQQILDPVEIQRKQLGGRRRIGIKSLEKNPGGG